VPENFFDKPILNSPYTVPTRHHALDGEGQPLDGPPVDGRRRSELITPVPKPKKKKGKKEQGKFTFEDGSGLSSETQEYNPTPIINEIREHVASWRALPNAADWSVTPTTQRLIAHWRKENWEGVRPFFCQVEAVETVIWLTEVARNQGRYAKFWKHIQGANALANPELMRIAMKMATGSGKTTVMAMLIAWQALNAARSPQSKLFSRAFLIIAPGITIKDRLRVLKGIDVFDPNTGEIRSNDVKDIAAWFIDTDYNEESFFVRHAYFLGAQDPYKGLKTALKAEIDPEAWEALYRETSRPFPRPLTGRIAVKVINHFGDEVMKVFGV